MPRIPLRSPCKGLCMNMTTAYKTAKKSQAEKTVPTEKRTRGQLVIDTTKLILCKYPASWTAGDISIMLKANIRTISRVLRDMSKAGLIERKYNSYTLSLDIANQFYGAKWTLKNEIEKTIMIESKKGDSNGKKFK